VAGVQNPAGGGRRLPGADIGEQDHVEAAVGERERAAESDHTGADHGDISGRVAHGVCRKKGMETISLQLKLSDIAAVGCDRTFWRKMKC
jgi:hypothetical protein